MSFELKIVPDYPCKAENDLSTKQFYAVEVSGANMQVDVCDAATDTVFGVLQNKPGATHEASVQTVGITKWVSDGSGTAITVGAFVGTNATGKAVAKATAGDKVRGIALEASSADGTIIAVELIHSMIHA